MIFSYYLHDEKSQQEFERKLIWFKKRYNLICLSELQEYLYLGRPLRNACMLSVDDGWRSTYDVVFPVMKKYNVPFTIFVSPQVMETGMNYWYYTLRYCDENELKRIIIRRGLFSEQVKGFPIELILKEIQIKDVYDVLDEYLITHHSIQIPRGFMNTQEVMELQDSGLVEVGAHTMTHPILRLENTKNAQDEIIRSITDLSRILGKRITSFAYPNGIKNVDFSCREMDCCKEAGITMAFSVDPGVISRTTNPLSIPRWGSVARLRFGRMGMYLPSRANQAIIRDKIKKFKQG